MKKLGIIIFIIALIAGIFFGSIFSYGKSFGNLFSFSIFKTVSGSGNVQTEQRNVGEFKSIDISGAFTVEIVVQKGFAVEVEADDNNLPLVKTEVENGVLKIEREGHFSGHSKVLIRVFAPNIENLEVSGASKVSVNDINNEFLNLDVSGASKIDIRGKTKRLKMDSSGASNIDAKNLKAKNVSVEASGASKIDVFVSNELNADLSGATKLTYSGVPKNVEEKTSGASSIRKNKNYLTKLLYLQI